MSTETTETKQSRRFELILHQIDSLPTLPAIATRLLTLTTSDDTNAREVIDLVSSDQTLTAKILSMCRRADLGIRDSAMTIDKAVVMLGFNAIRNAALSIKVFEVFNDSRTGSKNLLGNASDKESNGEPPHHFEREDFWRHCLAVGIASELIAAAHPEHADLPPSEAFVCGLMHDVGKLALDYVLPKSYARVIELADLNQGNIAEFERRIMGMDHHTAGKRLSEQWLLPYWIQDCIWLHGSDYRTLPKLGHRRMIGLVGLADLIVRRNHIGYSGNFNIDRDPNLIAQELGLNPKVVDSITHELHRELQHRSEALGLNEQPSHELFMQSIQQANQVLGRLNNALQRRTKTASHQSHVLETITRFHRESISNRGVQDAMDSVVASAESVLGAGYFAVLHQPQSTDGDTNQAWLVCQYDDQANNTKSDFVEAPPHSPELSSLSSDLTMPMKLMGVLPWLADHLTQAKDCRKLRLLPLSTGLGTVAVLLHDRQTVPPANELLALATTWGAAVAGAGRHEGTCRISEDMAEVNRELAESNRALADTQHKLSHAEAMGRLGEMASGAAHEMNNPLGIISGRSQLLAMSLAPGSKDQKAAQTIVDQSQRLSDLITSMHMFADPPKAQLEITDVTSLLDSIVKKVKNGLRTSEVKKPISLQFKSALVPTPLDPKQIEHAVTDLLINALQSVPKTAVHVMAYQDQDNQKLIIQVIDDGKGMDEYTLDHATDPFFSAKTAGRQMGMGLTRVKLFVKAHKGHLGLRSSPNAGTVAEIIIPLDLHR